MKKMNDNLKNYVENMEDTKKFLEEQIESWDKETKPIIDEIKKAKDRKEKWKRNEISDNNALEEIYEQRLFSYELLRIVEQKYIFNKNILKSIDNNKEHAILLLSKIKSEEKKEYCEL